MSRNNSIKVKKIIRTPSKMSLLNEFSKGTVKVLCCECTSIEASFNFYQYKMTQCNSLNVKLSN